MNFVSRRRSIFFCSIILSALAALTFFYSVHSERARASADPALASDALAPTAISLQPLVSGLTSPLLATNAGDGTRRLFIVQRGGIIKVVQPGSGTATDFINITARVSSNVGERGLLGLAFHPQFESNGYFFVHYTRTGDGATVISRFNAINSNTIGDPNSEVFLLTIAQPFDNHKADRSSFAARMERITYTSG